MMNEQLSEIGALLAGEPVESETHDQSGSEDLGEARDGSQEVASEHGEGEPETVEQTEGDGDVIEYLNAFAEEAGVDPGSVYGLKISLGDELGDLTIEETKDRIQEQARLISQLKEQTGEFESKLEQAQQAPQAAPVSQAMMEAQVRMQNLQREYASIDWSTLEQDDPGAAALHKQKYGEAYQAAQSQYENAGAEMQQQMQAAQSNAYQETLKAIPEWSDDATRSSELNNILGVTREYGFDDKDMQNVNDPRTFKMLRDLWKLKAEKAEATSALKAVGKAPKVLRSGVISNKAKGNKKLDSMIQQARNTRSRRTKASVGAAILSDAGIN